ncbi:MAG: hypothetical protein EA398_12185 [Deltaproteobacteria bacterium]|nr:MAG: hypothetical protein EA398_12185 [Deltaproteobacteria bacterium]
MKPNFFLALPLPADPFHAAAPPPPPLRRFHVPELHVTLAFLGPVSADAANQAFGAATADLDHAPVDFVPGPVLPFGPRDRFSALSSVPAEQAEPLCALMTAIARIAFPAAGRPLDPRPPRPHVTLARVPRRASIEERAAALTWAEQLRPGLDRVRLDTVALYTWTEDRRERLFRIVREVALAAA